jgi:hypothetical protein
MSNYQARALALLAGHGVVLVKVIEFSLAGRLKNLEPAWQVILVLPIAGMAAAYGALQAVDDKKRFWLHEVVSEVCAVVIAFGIVSLLLSI